MKTISRDARTVTIGDVAELAGVSTATVSRALAKPGSVRPETVKTVMAAVKSSGYTPNSSARMLRTQRTRMAKALGECPDQLGRSSLHHAQWRWPRCHETA